MAAIFFKDGQSTYIISNWMSAVNAGFHSVRSYYNHNGDTLEYFIHDNGCVLERISSKRRQPINNIYESKEAANNHFKAMNKNQTFATGKWVPERKAAR